MTAPRNITLIAAVAANSVIGRGNDLPWRLPSDLRHFKARTFGHRIVMGRKTWESIGSKPLSKRTNIVISSKEMSLGDEHLWFGSVPALTDYLESIDDGRETFIIGGQTIYEQTIAIADRLLISHIDHEFEGDRFFPSIDSNLWEIASMTQVPDDNYPYRIASYRKIIT